MKGIVENKYALDLIAFSPVLLVTSTYQNRNNIITVGWSTPVSFNPTVVAVVVGHSQLSHGMIENSREFAINIPDVSLLADVKLCGSVSGRDTDKFMETSLTEFKPLRVNPPLLKQCFAHIECRVVQSYNVGDHTIFCGDVASVMANHGVVREDGSIDFEKHKPILCMGDRTYFGMGGLLES